MDYTIQRARRKTLSLEITRSAQILVRAPKSVSREEITRFVAAHESWAITQQQKMLAYCAAHPEPSPAEAASLQAQARLLLPERVSFWSEKMGILPTKVKITSARTRFGSCNSKGVICFSWRLLAYPPAAIDYIVVHELAHLQQLNHSPAFWQIVESMLPAWRAAKALLK